MSAMNESALTASISKSERTSRGKSLRLSVTMTLARQAIAAARTWRSSSSGSLRPSSRASSWRTSPSGNARLMRSAWRRASLSLSISLAIVCSVSSSILRDYRARKCPSSASDNKMFRFRTGARTLASITAVNRSAYIAYSAPLLASNSAISESALLRSARIFS